MSSFKNIWKEINKYKSFLITTHHNPDADAASSALSMALVLKKLGKKTFVVNEDSMPSWLGFLPGSKTFHRKSTSKQPLFDAVIVLDCGDKARIGTVCKWIEGQPIINIDHHITNDKFGDVNLVMPKASSTCELLFELFQEIKFKMNKDLAKLLYAGIMTDTGSFRFENTSSKTFAIIAELVKFGISVPDMYERLYRGIPSKDIRNFVEVIHQAELLYNNKVYCVSLPKSIMDGFSNNFDLKEKVFGFLRSVEGIEVVVILSEVTPHQTRINFRSQNSFDVAKFSSRFNGGGHRRAAGAKLEISLSQAKKKILTALKKSL